MIPDLNRSYRGALHTPSDMRRTLGGRACPCQIGRSRGVLIRENCAVRRLDTKNGQISGVITEHGHVLVNRYCCVGVRGLHFLQGSRCAHPTTLRTRNRG